MTGVPYKEASGSPEMGAMHEVAVESMVQKMRPIFWDQAIECIADLLDSFAPGYVRPMERTAADDEEDAVFADAIEQLRQELIALHPDATLEVE